MSAYPAQIAGEAYLVETVMSAPPEELPLLLLDGALRFLARAETLAGDGDPAGLGRHIGRAQAIVNELNASLDVSRGGEIATNLRELYVFVGGELAACVVSRDAGRLASVAALLREIRDGYAHALRSR